MIRELNIRLDTSDPSGAGRSWAYRPPAPAMVLTCDAKTRVTTLRSLRRVEQQWGDPLEALRWLAATAASGLPRSRWIGWISYDAGHLLEDVPPGSGAAQDLPLFEFTHHRNGGHDLPVLAEVVARRAAPPSWNFTRTEYERAVRRAVDYIAAGDVFQVNLSRRCTLGLREPVAEVYARLLSRTPATYGALLDYGTHALVCNSPELFLRVTPQADGRRRVVTRPIKGTRPRGAGMEEQLRGSAKDQAELNMIVDLERNDLGRVCEVGTVKVTEPRTIEAHPTVYHGVATVEGILRPEVTFVDLLRATFPGGSVTGAPKIRAMEIIDELEPTRRGPYCGAIGYLDSDGTIEFNVAIRTMIVTPDQFVHVPVGGGIVADSDPAAEYEETQTKARAMLEALGVAESEA